MWDDKIDLNIVHSSRTMICAQVKGEKDKPNWLLIGVYGPCKGSEKHQFWVDLLQITKAFGGPWLAVRDWNDITSVDERLGRAKRASSSITAFAKFIEESGGIDLGCVGPKFTWSNKQDESTHVKPRLDRAIANIGWCSLFPRVGVLHATAILSDHDPIIIQPTLQSDNGPRPFRFFEAWTRDQSSFDVVQTAWNFIFYGTEAFQLHKRIQAVKVALKTWNKDQFGICQEHVKWLIDELTKIQHSSISATNLEAQASLEKQIEET